MLIMLRKLSLLGTVDQVVDSTDVLADPRTYRRLAGLHPRQDSDPPWFRPGA